MASQRILWIEIASRIAHPSTLCGRTISGKNYSKLFP